MPQELTAGQLAESVNNPATSNRGQNSYVPGMGRTRQGRHTRTPPESSTHPLPAYAKEPGESEQIILQEIAALPTNQRFGSVVEDGGTSTENPEQSQRPPPSLPASPPFLENCGADNSSSSNPLTNSHIPSGSRIGMTVEAVENHSSAALNLRGDAPPPYVEVVSQRVTVAGLNRVDST